MYDFLLIRTPYLLESYSTTNHKILMKCFFKGRTIIFLEGGGGGGGVWKIFLCKLFLTYAPLQTFVSKCKLIFLHISCLQAIYFIFLGPANIFFSIFFIPSPPFQKNNGPSLSFNQCKKRKHKYKCLQI